MKDMMGIEIGVGMLVCYFHPGPGGMVHEEARVIKINPKTVRIEYLGTLHYGKNKGEKGNIFNTTGKLFIINKDIELERLAFQEQINDLKREVDSLNEEVDKIHYRSDILDL